MISAVVFSRDRPAQLDLLLRSIQAHASWIGTTTVIYKTSTPDYRYGYDKVRGYHFGPSFQPERDFRAQTLEALTGDHTVFLCDDDVLFRPRPFTSPRPQEILSTHHDVLAFSLRLGMNTTGCYSMDAAQKVPSMQQRRHSGDVRFWTWRGQEHDYGYAGSLDGNVWRTDQVRTLIENSPVEWGSPNELEDALNLATRSALLPTLACYEGSILVGTPVNSVQTAYDTNRHAEKHRAPLLTLNKHFLAGRRLSLSSVCAADVRSAHVEVKLVWDPPGSSPQKAKKTAADSGAPTAGIDTRFPG